MPNAHWNAVRAREYRRSLEAIITTLSAHRSRWVKDVCQTAKQRMEYIDNHSEDHIDVMAQKFGKGDSSEVK